MMVSKGLADGLIAGANSKTKPYYAVFHIIQTAKNVSRTSGVFLMHDSSGKNISFFADCALNINPSADMLAEIALLSAKTCSDFGFEPRVALLSFSTRGSAKHEMVDKVRLATAIVKKKNPSLVVDGEIQLDAAVVPEVSEKKCPDSVLKGKANVLIFPDLNSGNIGYKLVQRFAGFEAIGPILQGLNKPANDLSRGCSVSDVVVLSAITVIQSASQNILQNESSIFSENKKDDENKDNSDNKNNKNDGSFSSSFAKSVSLERKKIVDSVSSSRPLFLPSEKKAPSIDMLPKEIRKIIEDSRKKQTESDKKKID
jgi:hypothetical protein